MKSFLKEIESKFQELEELVITDTDNTDPDPAETDEIEEISTSGAVAGYNTPNAFTSEEDFKKKKFKYESVQNAMDDKYIELIESYRNFANGDPKKSPEQKVKATIQEIAKKLQEIETLVNYNSRLKNEAGVTSNVYGSSTTKALTKISERLIKISERIRSLGE